MLLPSSLWEESPSDIDLRLPCAVPFGLLGFPRLSPDRARLASGMSLVPEVSELRVQSYTAVPCRPWVLAVFLAPDCPLGISGFPYPGVNAAADWLRGLPHPREIVTPVCTDSVHSKWWASRLGNPNRSIGRRPSAASVTTDASSDVQDVYGPPDDLAASVRHAQGERFSTRLRALWSRRRLG